MTFPTALLCIQLFGFWALARAVDAPSSTAWYGRLGLHAVFLGSLVNGGALVLPMVGGSSHATSLFPMFLLAGALVIAAGCGLIIACSRRAGTRSFFDQATIVILLCCAYLAFTAGDHLQFFWDKERTGYLDGSIAAEAGIVCEQGFVLIRIDHDNASVTYCCPHNIAIGNPLDEPFVPWPTYHEGSSPELFRALRRLQSSAVDSVTR